MTKWIMPVACVFVLAACNSFPGKGEPTDAAGSSGYSSGASASGMDDTQAQPQVPAGATGSDAASTGSTPYGANTDGNLVEDPNAMPSSGASGAYDMGSSSGMGGMEAQPPAGATGGNTADPGRY